MLLAHGQRARDELEGLLDVITWDRGGWVREGGGGEGHGCCCCHVDSLWGQASAWGGASRVCFSRV